jgi:hypothetical protein
MGLIDSKQGDADALVQLEQLVFHGYGSLGADVYDTTFTRQSLAQDAFVLLCRTKKACSNAYVCEL